MLPPSSGPLKRWYPTTTLYSVTTQKTWTWFIYNFGSKREAVAGA